MDGHHGLKRALIMFSFVILHLVQAQDQQGFISLDCGLPPNQSPYIEPTLKLNFSSDAGFIKSGKSGRIADAWDYKYQQYNALRYFPDGTRHCYDLSVKQGINYLIRAGFAYGNYDGLNAEPRFDLHIGPNYWSSVDSSLAIEYEIIHMAMSTSLQICLVKTGVSTPFISTLELRPLRNDAYSTRSGSLELLTRKFFNSNLVGLRYPDDVHDRVWNSEFFMFEIGGQEEINTTLSVNSSNPFHLPEVIARSAVTSANAEPLYFYQYAKNPSDNIFVYLYFAEIQELRANDTREIDIVWNENITNSAYSPKKLEMETIFTSPDKCDADHQCEIKLAKTGKSTFPPLLNAYEVYKIMELPYSETY